jgi:hypothetical protein
MPRDDASDLGAKLDRITYLLVAILALQMIQLLDLGAAGLFLFLIVGMFVTALYNADV